MSGSPASRCARLATSIIDPMVTPYDWGACEEMGSSRSGQVSEFLVLRRIACRAVVPSLAAVHP